MSEVTYVLKTQKPPMLPVRMYRALRSAWTGPMSLKDPALNRLFSESSQSTAGIAITPEVAFTYSAVYDAVNQIASDVAKMPLNHMKRLPNGGSEQYTKSKLYRLLKYQPNPEMDTMVLRRQLTAWALVSHGGFAEIIRDGAGRPVEMWPIEPHRVEVRRPELRNGKLGKIEYSIDGGDSIIPSENMIHLSGLGYTPHSPYTLIDKARQAIGLALAAERFGAAFFGNGSTFGGMLLADNPPNSPEEAKELRATVESIHKGPDRAHKLAVLWGGLKYQPLGVKPNESQMNELRDKQVEEVARFFRIPPSRLGLTKPGTMSYNSVEMANLDYYTGCLLDWVTLWELQLIRKCIPESEWGIQYVKHNANVFLRGDIKSRYEALGIARDKGIISANEWRDLEDMNPQAGSQGDMYLVQSAQVPLDKLSALVDSQIKKNSTPKPAPPAPGGPAPDADRDATIAAAVERAARADALVAETRARLEEQIAARQAADTATAAELDAMRETERVTACMLGTHIALAESMRAQAADAEAARREAEIGLARETDARTRSEHDAAAATAEADRLVREADTAREAAIQQAAEARELLALREAEVDAAIADRDAALAREAEGLISSVDAQEARIKAEDAAQEARTKAEAAEIDRSAAESLAQEAEAKAAATVGDRAELEAQRQAAETLAQEARSLAEQAEAERERLAGELTAAEAREADAVSVSQAAHADAETLRAQAAEAEQARQEAVAAAVLAASEREAAELEASILVAERDRVVAEAEEALNRAKAAQTVAEQAQLATESRVQSRDAALLAASRALVIEAMGVLVRRECAQAKAKQATPEKLRSWLSGFGVVHQPLCVERLLPSLRLHMVLVGSDADPSLAAETMAREHIAEFERHLRAVLESEPEEFHGELDRMLTRWETERPDAVADRMLVEGIRHVR